MAAALWGIANARRLPFGLFVDQFGPRMKRLGGGRGGGGAGGDWLRISNKRTNKKIWWVSALSVARRQPSAEDEIFQSWRTTEILAELLILLAARRRGPAVASSQHTDGKKKHTLKSLDLLLIHCE